MVRTAPARTVRALLPRLAPFGPAVVRGELVFATDPPADLGGVLGVLHTGVRALPTGRAWWGAGGDRPRLIELCSDAPIPAGIDLLCVAGDARWDRIRPDARLDRPHLFTPAGPSGSSRHAGSPARSGNSRTPGQSELRAHRLCPCDGFDVQFGCRVASREWYNRPRARTNRRIYFIRLWPRPLVPT